MDERCNDMFVRDRDLLVALGPSLLALLFPVQLSAIFDNFGDFGNLAIFLIRLIRVYPW